MTTRVREVRQASRSPHERRRSVREPVGTVGSLHIEGDKHLQVMVMNVSLHGVGFRAPCAITINARHTIRIGTGPIHIASQLQVVTCRRRADGTYDVGAKFV